MKRCLVVGISVILTPRSGCDIDINRSKPGTWKYVILGYGVSGQAALNEILQHDKQGSVLVVDPNNSQDSVVTGDNVTLIPSQATHLDVKNRHIKFQNGFTADFEKCLISTGRNTTLVKSRYIENAAIPYVYDMRDKDSIGAVSSFVHRGHHVSIIGEDWSATLLSIRLNAEAISAGYQGTVSLLLPSSGPWGGVLPRYLCTALSRRLSARGIEVLPYSQIRYISSPDALPSKLTVHTSPNIGLFVAKSYDALQTAAFGTDVVLICSDHWNSSTTPTKAPPPTKPTTPTPAAVPSVSNDFLHGSGLELDAGGAVMANSYLSASADIFVAGDRINVPGPMGRTVYSGVDHARVSGTVAGGNMAGRRLPYDHIPIYEATSLTLGVHFLAIGYCSSALESHGFWWKIDNNNMNRTTDKTKEMRNASKEIDVGMRNAIGGDGGGDGSRENSPHSSGSWKSSQYWQELTSNKVSVIKSSKSTPLPMVPVPVSIKIISPLLGLGVVIYMTNDIVSGVLISGAALACQLSPEGMETMKSRCRALIGRHVNSLVDAVASEQIETQSQSWPSPPRQSVSSRLSKIQAMRLVASDLLEDILPSNVITTDAIKGTGTGTGVALTRGICGAPVYRHATGLMAVAWAQEKTVLRRGPAPEMVFATGRNS
eukprot:gene7782-15921_t